jgi:hypothetical protein
MKENPMSNIVRSAVNSAIAIALLGSLAGPALAAPGQVCYFGECVPSVAPTVATTAPAAPTGAPAVGQKTIAQHGSWSGVVDGDIDMIVDKFNDGSTFAVAFEKMDKGALVMSSPKWRLTAGQILEMKITIDGRLFTGKASALDSQTIGMDGVSQAFVQAFYHGHKAQVSVGEFVADITVLPDAAATLDDVANYVRTAQG